MAQNLEDTDNHQPSRIINEKDLPVEHIDRSESPSGNLIYDDADEEPELHARTYLALAAMFMLNFVQVFALQGPPSVLSYIGADLHDTTSDTWVPNALSLIQAVLGPVIASASDTFQARKTLLVGTSVVSFVGSAIAPGSTSLGRLIAAQALIGVGFAAVPLAYSVPSEITPRKWRPVVQGAMNVAASVSAVAGPLLMGAFTRAEPANGWRKFYWIQMAFWGITALGIFFGYRPPKRHTRLDHLSLIQKIGQLDLVGFGLLSAGLTLLLTGLNLGGNLYSWTNARVLGPLVTGIGGLILFGLYEWKATSTGIFNHELFQGGNERGRTFAICVALIFIEGILLFSVIIFYPVLTTSIFETDPLLLVLREIPFFSASALFTMCYGFASTRWRTIRSPLFVGFLLLTGGIIGLATVQPKDPGNGYNAIIFNGLAGAGFAAPLVLIVAGV